MRKIKYMIAISFIMLLMSVGMCSASNDFCDVVGTDYELPVKALEKLRIINTYSDGTFLPNKEVNRAEMTKILISAYGLEKATDYTKDMQIFKDVSSDSWASGYINLAYDCGFLIESAGTDFRPTDSVTYAEALAYCVRTLGYGVIIYKNGSWPSNYMTVANDIGLTKDLNIKSYDDALTRGELTIILWNVMNSNMLEYFSTEEGGGWKKTNKTFLEIKYPNKVNEIENL